MRPGWRFLLAAAGLSLAGVANAAPRAAVIVQDVTVVSPERALPLRHADVLISDGRIAAVGRRLKVPQGAERIDGRGRFLVPGLIDSHVHLGHSAALTDDEIDRHPDLWTAYRAQVPRAYLAFGFTTVVDLDMTPKSRAWFEALPLKPRLLHCGQGVKVAGGYGAQKVDPAKPPNLVYEPAAAASWPKALKPDDFTPGRAVARAAGQGATCLKVFVEPGFGVFDWPVPHAGTLQALHRAARAHGMVMAVHATGVDSWRAAIDSGAEVIAHGLWVWPGDPDDATPPPAARAVIAAAARAGVHVQPTLQVTGGERALLDPGAVLDDPRLGLALPASVIAFLRTPEARADNQAVLKDYVEGAPPPGFEHRLATAIARDRAAFRLMLADHVPLLFGSDTPAGDGVGNPPGLNGRLEMQGWADLGATPAQVLRAATLENARVFGLADRLGTIAPGKDADLLLLSADPLADVAAYDRIETVFLGGRPIPRSELRPTD